MSVDDGDGDGDDVDDILTETEKPMGLFIFVRPPCWASWRLNLRPVHRISWIASLNFENTSTSYFILACNYGLNVLRTNINIRPSDLMRTVSGH